LNLSEKLARFYNFWDTKSFNNKNSSLIYTVHIWRNNLRTSVARYHFIVKIQSFICPFGNDPHNPRSVFYGEKNNMKIHYLPNTNSEIIKF
jgi:hypothetical protein